MSASDQSLAGLRRALIAAVALAVLAVASAWGPAWGQAPPGAWPRCIAERDGQQIGLGGSVCECRHEQGGTMIGRPPGWRWSCDIMRMDGGRSEPSSGLAESRRHRPSRWDEGD